MVKVEMERKLERRQPSQMKIYDFMFKLKTTDRKPKFNKGFSFAATQ